MDMIGFVTAIFVFFLVSDVSSGAFDLKFRKLGGSDSETSTNSSQTKEPPIPSNAPVPGAKQLNSNENGGKSNQPEVSQILVSIPPTSGDKISNASATGSDLPISKQHEEKDKQLSPPPTNTKERDTQVSPPPTNTKESGKRLSPLPASTKKETDKQLSPEEKETDKKLTPPTETREKNCDGKRIRCQIPNTISACVQNSEFESKEWVILVQNDVEEDLKVNLIVPTSLEDYNKKEVSIPKHQTKEIKIPHPPSRKGHNITVSTKNGYCNLELQPPPAAAAAAAAAKDEWILQLPTTELLTPINGAYFLVFTVVTLGGVWACCKCRKRRRRDLVGYQELEMASPETAAAANPDSAEGWDQVWDDEWDEESAVKSPGHRISANGLTSRAVKKDGWEDD